MLTRLSKVALLFASAILFSSNVNAQDPQLRRADFFGFQAAVRSSFSNGGSSSQKIILPNTRWLEIRGVGTSPSSEYQMPVGFLPVPYSASMNVQTVDTLIAFYKRSMVNGQLRGWKYQYQPAVKEPFEIKGLTDVYKITLISERLENEGIIGKEAYIADRHELIYIGFTEDRVFIFRSEYGKRHPKDKYFKEKNKEFATFLKSLTILDSPRKNLLKSPTDGFYYVMNDTVPLLMPFKSMYFDEGLVYRKGADFVVREFPTFGKEVDFDKWDGKGILKLNDESRLKPELEKQIGVNAFYRIEYHTEDEGLKKGFYYMDIEDKPGVFYVIRCKSNEEKRKILDGGFAADFVRVLNVFSQNRADMPSFEAAAARGKELVSFYYSVQENEAKESFSKVDAIRKQYAGKIIFRSKDKLDAPQVNAITMVGDEKVYMFVYPYDGTQPSYKKRKFSIRVSGNGRTGEFEYWNLEYTGSTTVRGFGGSYLTGPVFSAHTNELGEFLSDRSSTESWSASNIVW
ncbi:MAG: hypothetical protein ACK40M_09995 [Flavobacteriales bacterium]